MATGNTSAAGKSWNGRLFMDARTGAWPALRVKMHAKLYQANRPGVGLNRVEVPIQTFRVSARSLTEQGMARNGLAREAGEETL